MDKFNIAICDDETLDLTNTVEFVKRYDLQNQMHVEAYFRAIDLLEAGKKKHFDIILLDIEMEPPSGFDIAKKFVELDVSPTIIFTTKSKAYSLKGYGIAIRYLQKPLSYDMFCEAMDVALAEATAHRLTIQIDGVLHAIRLRDVQYIEIFGHYATVHTVTDKYRFRTTLRELIGKLPRGYFVPTHKSYIVNLEHVKSATSTNILLDCGSIIPIGRTKSQDFNQALFRFLGR